MAVSFTIRPAGEGDVDAIWRVHRAAIQHTCATHYGADVIDAWVERLKPDSYRAVVLRGVVVIADAEGTAIGFGQLDVTAGEIQAVYVSPAAQGHGVGAALLAHLEQVALKRGLGRVTLKATLNAEMFYAAHGWRATGRDIRKITQEVALSCVSMEKVLAEGTSSE